LSYWQQPLMSYSFFPSPTHAVLSPSSRPAITEPAHLSHSPSPRSSLLYSPSHLRLGSRDLDKLLGKAAKLEAQILKEPVNVRAYQRKWYADYQAKSVPSMKNGGKLLPLIRKGSPAQGVKKHVIRVSPDPVERLADSGSGVHLRRVRRKQSEQELDKIFALCSTEQTTRRKPEGRSLSPQQRP